MIKKTKKRMTILVFSVLVCLIVVMLILIYASAYLTINKDNKKMLTIYAEGYNNTQTLDSTSNSLPDISEESIKKHIQVYDFYAIAFDSDGTILMIDNDASSGLENDSLEALSQTILEKNKTFGHLNDFVYLVDRTTDYTLVVMIDNTIVSESSKIMTRYILLFGSIFVLLLIVLSRILVNWVMQPVEKGYEKQKQFISDAGHELKTPISTIEANSSLLEREIGQNQWLDNIVYENKRMFIMVKELLDLTKIEHVAPILEEIDFVELIMDAALPFEASAYEQGISISYNLPEKQIVTGDKIQLEKMVSILVDNAISHCSSNGEIQIALSQKKNKVLFQVSNPGEEIPVTEREKIFERFYRLDESREHKEGHYGLGLSIAQNIVHSHGGKINVDCSDGRVIFRVIL